MVYMFVFENYNLKPDYMYFISSNNNGPDLSYLVIFGIICIIFVLGFIFRVSIVDAKENLKKSIRAYIKPFFFKVRGDTLYTPNEGPIQFVWEYLDEYFLTPSLPGSHYEHLYEYEKDDDEEDNDEDGEDKEEDGEDEEEDGEEEEDGGEMKCVSDDDE